MSTTWPPFAPSHLTKKPTFTPSATAPTTMTLLWPRTAGRRTAWLCSPANFDPQKPQEPWKPMCTATGRHGDIFLHFKINADKTKKISWQNYKVMHKWLFSQYLKYLGKSLWLYCDGNSLPVSAERLDKKTYCQIKLCLKVLCVGF